MNSYATEKTTDRSLHWMWWLIYFGVFTAGFWLIDHTPFASDYYRINSLAAETDNRTADRIESVNVITAPVRVLLGMLGCACLLMPNHRRLRWGGLILGLLLLHLA